jgi:hypothetical protein
MLTNGRGYLRAPSRLLKRAHLRRWHAGALIAAYRKYASLGPARAALHLDLFEQPDRERVFQHPARTGLALLLTVSALFALTACAVKTPVQQVPTEVVATNLQYQNVVFRTFTAAPEVQNPDAAILDCMRSAMDHLQTKNIFKRVENQATASYAEPTMFVDLRLTDLRLVSGTARFWGGVMSGRSHMKVMVKLTDARGAVVAEQELFGAPNAYGSAYSLGSSDRELPKNMGILVGDFVLANAGKK